MLTVSLVGRTRIGQVGGASVWITMLVKGAPRESQPVTRAVLAVQDLSRTPALTVRPAMFASTLCASPAAQAAWNVQRSLQSVLNATQAFGYPKTVSVRSATRLVWSVQVDLTKTRAQAVRRMRS
jgi:hypothetical protein